MLKPMDGKSLNKWIINLQIQQMHSWLIPSGMKQVSHVLAYYSWYLCHTTLFMNGLNWVTDTLDSFKSTESFRKHHHVDQDASIGEIDQNSPYWQYSV